MSLGGVLGSFRSVGTLKHTRVSVLFSCDPSMLPLIRSLNSSHVVGVVSDVHGVFGLLPSAGLVSSILLSSLFWSSASCAMFGSSKGPNPLCCVKIAPSGFDGVCILDTPSVLTTCETDFLSYVSFDSACISYGVLLAVIPICFALGFITKALGFWVFCRTAVAAPVVWLCPLLVYLDVAAMPDLLSVSSCCPVLLCLQPRFAISPTSRIPHPAQQPQQPRSSCAFVASCQVGTKIRRLKEKGSVTALWYVA